PHLSRIVAFSRNARGKSGMDYAEQHRLQDGLIILVKGTIYENRASKAWHRRHLSPRREGIVSIGLPLANAPAAIMDIELCRLISRQLARLGDGFLLRIECRARPESPCAPYAPLAAVRDNMLTFGLHPSLLE